MNTYKEMTFEQLAELKSATILCDAYENGVRYLIMRGPAALCAYVGVPSDHPLAGKNYDDVLLNVHGGLTFSGEGDGLRPKGWYWYGWDYGHFGDKSFYDLQYGGSLDSIAKEWTVADVQSEIRSATYDFSKFVDLLESTTR